MTSLNLSLYTVSGFIITDTDGHRVLAKYYHPPGAPLSSSKKLTTLKEQRAFEKGLFQKTKKAGGACVRLERLVLPGLTAIPLQARSSCMTATWRSIDIHSTSYATSSATSQRTS